VVATPGRFLSFQRLQGQRMPAALMRRLALRAAVFRSHRRSASLRRRASSAASANNQFRKVTIFGRFEVAFGQMIQ
jgi:hypothetical protein